MSRRPERLLLKDIDSDPQNHAPYGVSYYCIECDDSVIPGDPHFEEELCEVCYYEKIGGIKMSERLEEIKYDYRNTEFASRFFTSFKNIDWLIEQTERALEYDRCLISLEAVKQHMAILEQQDKRYRESRKMIEKHYDDNYEVNAYGYEDGYLDGLSTAMGIIDKVLEVIE